MFIHEQSISVHMFEKCVVALSTTLSVWAVFLQPHYEMQLYILVGIQFDPEVFAKHGRHSDSTLLLLLNCLVAAVHLLLPIRWIALVPFDICCVLVYTLTLFVFGSTERLAFANLLLFALIILCSCLGKRRMELVQRNQFADIVSERVSRAVAEFSLAQIDSENRDEQERRRLEAPSEQRTTLSDDVIRRVYDGQSVLQDLRLLGCREHWIFPHDCITVSANRVLGRGGFGVVRQGKLLGAPVAVKIAKPRNRNAALNATNCSIVNELRVYRHLRHPNIVCFYGACVDATSGCIALVMELINGPSLTQLVSNGSVSQSDRDDIVLQIVRAVRFLHTLTPPIAHGDIKPDNLLVDRAANGPCVKLVDFGLSRVIRKNVRTRGGSLMWLAPEVVKDTNDGFETCADVYAFGLIFYFVQTGRHPLQDNPLALCVRKLLSKPPGITLSWPKHGTVPSVMKLMSSHCIEYLPESRPHIKDVHVCLEAQRGNSLCSDSTDWLQVIQQRPSLPDSVFAVFDLYDTDMRMLEASNDFEDVINCCSRLTDMLGYMVLPKDVQSVQDVIHGLLYSSTSNIDIGRIRFTHVISIEFEADMIAKPIHYDDDDSGGNGADILNITLHNIRWVEDDVRDGVEHRSFDNHGYSL
eukprot:TRINITY_DN31543_c0_g1_i1.p1 TRINITY_DN31543_c0_g1~~TRINITY_DN31543_c0_g1_i1.p1  ORF type:complete len:730 (+),score=22.19 TRINITY_DN31543_c0_g1_i1:275-2191(+)